MFPRIIEELRCHPAQLMALKAAGLVTQIEVPVFPEISGEVSEGPIPEDLVVRIGYRTAMGQAVTVSKYLPEEGLFLPGSKAAREAEKTEAGDARRRKALKQYRENFGS